MAMARALVEFTYTKDNAAEAVRAGLMISMPGLLAFDVHDAAVFSGLELLWNCVEFGAPGSRCGPVGRDTIEGVAVALHRLLVQFIDKGFRESDKHTRNEASLESRQCIDLQDSCFPLFWANCLLAC